MKRSPLNRKTPMKRTAWIKRGGPKRKPAKRQSHQSMSAAQYYRSVECEREKWRVEQIHKGRKCWLCGGTFTNIHEMEKKSHATRNWGHVYNYFASCNECNLGPILNSSSKKNHTRQLALKQINDPGGYSLSGFLSVQPRGPDYVTQADVNLEIDRLKGQA